MNEENEVTHTPASLFDIPMSKPVQLKFEFPGFWGATDTAVPTEVTKTNIFNVAEFKGRTRGVYHEHVEFFSSLKSVQCFYKGPALDHRDADVWIACLSIWKQNPSSENKVDVTISAITKKLGMIASGKVYDSIRASIDRLYRSNVKYVTIDPSGTKHVKEFHLISGLEYIYEDDGTSIINSTKNQKKEYTVESIEDIDKEDDDAEANNVPTLQKSRANKLTFMIDPNMQHLFQHVSWTDFDKRKMLTSQTAKALEFHAIGHKRGQMHYSTYENLAKLCGRKYNTKGNKYIFREAVREALEELKLVKIMESYTMKATCVEWVVEKDLGKPVDHDRNSIRNLLRSNRELLRDTRDTKSKQKKFTWKSVTPDDMEDFFKAKMKEEEMFSTLLEARCKAAINVDPEIIKKQIILDWLNMNKCDFLNLLFKDAEQTVPPFKKTD